MKSHIKNNKYNNLYQEMKICYREYFESKLAVLLLKHHDCFPSLHKMSHVIFDLLTKNKDSMIQEISQNYFIRCELSQPYFGYCFEKEENVTATEIFKKICSVLRDKSSDISKVMQIHIVFNHRLYDSIGKKQQRKELLDQIHEHNLFKKQNRSRLEIKTNNITLSNQAGISRHTVFTKMLGQTSLHLRAMDKFILDRETSFFKSANEKNIPIVSGVSGHAASLFVGAKLFGNFNDDEIKEYAIIVFAFLTAGGHHSFYETMIVMSMLGIDVNEENYHENLPISFKQTAVYKKYCSQFPEFLETLNEDHCKRLYER